MEAGASAGFIHMDSVVNSSNVQPDNAKTRQATRYGVRLFREYCVQHGVDSINNLPAREIARMLKGFYGQARTKDGQRFSVNSLIAIRYAISRYYRSPMVHRKIDIVKDNVFHEANETFRAVLKDLERESRGTACQKELQMVDMDDRRKLRHYFEHAISTPRGLLQKVWYDLMLRVGRRGRDSQRMLNKNSFRIAKAADGRQYIYQVDEEEAGIIMEIPGDPLCPVKTLKFYLTRLNPACKALFQRPKEHAYEQDTCWYVNSPVGKNMLATMMSTISKCARLSRVYTNVRIRATTYSPADGKGCIPCTGVADALKPTESTPSATATQSRDTKKQAETKTESKQLFSQNSQIIKQLNAPVGQHCLPQRSAASETAGIVVTNSTPALASNIFPAAFAIVKDSSERPPTIPLQNGETSAEGSKCASCKKKLEAGCGILLTTNDGMKQYCSTDCLGKWIASEQSQTSSLFISTPQVTASTETTDASKLLSMHPVDYTSGNNFQKLLTVCSPANLLIPFSPSVYSDYAGSRENEVSRSDGETTRSECRSASPQLIVPDEIPPETIIVETQVPETNDETFSTNSIADTDERKEMCDQGVMCQPTSSSLAILCKPILKSQGIQTDPAPYSSKNFMGSSNFYSPFPSTKVKCRISEEEGIVENHSELNGEVFECLEDPCDTCSLTMSVEEDDEMEELENIELHQPLPVVKREEVANPDIFASAYSHRGRTTKRTTWDEIAQRSKLQTLWGVKVFREWLQSRGSQRNFENLEAILLASVLEEFYENLTKPDGEEYSVSTMHTIRASISRYLTLPPQSKPFSIIRDREFKKANEAFYRRIRRLQNPRQNNYSFPVGQTTTMWQPQSTSAPSAGMACNSNGIMLLHLAVDHLRHVNNI